MVQEGSEVWDIQGAVNMRLRMEEMQGQMQEFVAYINDNLGSVSPEAADHLTTSLVPVNVRMPVPIKPRKKAAKKAAKRKA